MVSLLDEATEPSVVIDTTVLIRTECEIDTFSEVQQLFIRDTIPVDSMKYINEIRVLKSSNDMLLSLNDILAKENSDLKTENGNLAKELNILEDMYEQEKENSDILSRSMRIPGISSPPKQFSPPVQSLMASIEHLGNYPWQPEEGSIVDQVRLRVCYSRQTDLVDNGNLWWFGGISFDVYNRFKQETPVVGLTWGYQYKW